MGAYNFTSYGHGINVHDVYEDVFDQAISNGIHPNHLRNKGQLKKVALPEKANKKNIYDIAEDYLEKDSYQDKYGPMYYFEIPNAISVKTKVISGSTVNKSSEKGSIKWETVYTVSYEEFKHGQFFAVNKDFKTNPLATAFAKELAMNGLHSTINISKKPSNAKLSQLATVAPKYKEVTQKQSLFVFFSVLPS